MTKKGKFLLLLSILALSGVTYGEEEVKSKWDEGKLNYELKAGITPYEKYGSKTYSERFNNGLDFGMEAYKRFDSYALGFGGEVKKKLNNEFIKEDGERLCTYYALAKKNITDTVSLVGRIGKTSQKEFDSSYYVAGGLEKRVGRVTIQVLGENTKLKNNYSDKNYTTVGLKFGYIFGDIPESVKLDPPKDPVPEVVATEPVEPKFKLTVSGDEITGGYSAYKTEIPAIQIENVKEMTQQLNEYDKSGTLEMTAYSDNTGSKELNIKLANERMNNLEKEFVNSGLTEKVRIQKNDPSKTVKNIYKVDNDSAENRKLNRRIEVSFFEDEEVKSDDGEVQKNNEN